MVTITQPSTSVLKTLQERLDPSAIGQSERQEIETQRPRFARLLDATADRQITEDIARIGKSVFGQMFGKNFRLTGRARRESSPPDARPEQPLRLRRLR